MLNEQQKNISTMELGSVKKMKLLINRNAMRYREIIDEESKLYRTNQRGIYPEPIECDGFEELRTPEEIEKQARLDKMSDDEKALAEIPTVSSTAGEIR